MASFEDFMRNLRRGIGSPFAKRKMRAIGKLAIERIVARTRRGSGVSRTGGEQSKLKELSASYIDYRKSNRRLLDATTSPSKSNLTFSGRLLRSMVIKEVTNRRVRWGPKNNRRAGSTLTNELLGEYVSEQGRPFNYLSKQDINAVRRSIEKSLRREIRKL